MNITCLNHFNSVACRIDANKQNFTSTYRVTLQPVEYKHELGPYGGMYVPHSCGDKIVVTDPLSHSLCANNTVVVNANITSLFRRDLPWRELPGILKEHFPLGEVKIHNFACSDGSEPYTLALSLISEFGLEEAQRFFPIQASDIDLEIINEAKSGILTLTDYDICKLRRFINESKHRSELMGMFKMRKEIYKNGQHMCEFELSDDLKNAVEFKCQDIADGMKEAKGEQTFILARNMWKYLSQDQIAQATKNMMENVNANALMAIGDFEKVKGDKLPYFMEAMGLYPISDKRDFSNILKCDGACIFKTADIESWGAYIREHYFDEFAPKDSVYFALSSQNG